MERSASDDYDTAILYLLRIVTAAPLDDDAHLALVKTASDAGRHGEARRYYAMYAVRREALGAPLARFPGRGRVV